MINVQHPIRINDLNEPEPDLTILKPKGDYYASAHPISNDVFIVVEVADTTYEYDRQIKLPLYAQAEISEYWLVNSSKNEIEVYRLPAKGAYKKMEIFYSEDTLKLDFCNQTVDVSRLLG